MALFSLSMMSNTLVVAFLSLALLNPTKADLVDDICSQAANDPQYCVQRLRSDPRSSSADLPTLAQITIGFAQSDTKSTADLVKSLEQQATDPKLKERYKSCLENYNGALNDLNDCTNDLKKKDYPSLNIHASAAGTEADTCDDNFSDPPIEPDNLKKASKHVQDLTFVICAIANKL
ncbi:hypothetical protein ACH5RR_030965 [Cinchona calisaya]|uniref:Pectinesterase inhibitor domain-containing protein n=1 Tax=Cinchona calisaya TaxID=153742 RepID=A0ABD2YEX2_9GENT